jgi:putative DNA primase/helicase
MSLAPLEWWEMAYPKNNGGADWQLAGNDLMRACEKAGIYSQDRERGRGAWHDAGRSVLHLGDRLLINGEHSMIHDIDSKYIYTRQAPLESGKQAISATDEAAAQVSEIMKGLNWTSATHANLLAGWCFLAPICGALKWRPHLWLTAQRGAGKTWVQDHIINPLLGPAAMMVQGATTEAGIRQRLKQDARPIVFDEAESEDQNSQKRMQMVIELARQSSSDSTAEIVKGTAGGQGMAFRMRSMF